MAHFISKLTDADGEAAETQVWLDFALHCGYLQEADHSSLSANYDVIAGGLVKMLTEPEKWCGPAGLVHDESGHYDAGA